MKQENINTQTALLPGIAYPSLEPLNALVGEWNLEISHPSDPAMMVYGLASFEWLAGDFFLVEHWDVSQSNYPTGMAIIGWDATNESYCMYYFDSRGVSRVYEMSLNNGLWKISRESPGFYQRFTGAFSGDRNSIKGHWEKSIDNLNWEIDFNMTYTKIKAENEATALRGEKREKLSLEETQVGSLS